MNKVQKKIKF